MESSIFILIKFISLMNNMKELVQLKRELISFLVDIQKNF